MINFDMKKFILFILLFCLHFLLAQKGDKFSINGLVVNFPQKVEYKSTIKNSGQFHFVDEEKTNILVSIRDSNKMEFYNEKFDEAEMLDAFYKWDFDYWKSNSVNAKVSEIEKNPEKKYILWKVQLEGYASIFLFGIIDNKVISISTNNDKISDEDQIKFLQEIYNKITVFKN